jgi:hypothetical protein
MDIGVENSLPLAKWGLFTVAIAVLPFAGVGLIAWLGDDPFSFAKLWQHGELLLVSIALSADAIGDLIFSTLHGTTRPLGRVVLTGVCLLLFGLEILFFALVQNNSRYNIDKISEGSIFFFVFTLLAGAIAKLVAIEPALAKE